MDRDDIVRAGLEATYDFWSAATLWAALCVALAMAVAGFAAYQVQFGIPNKAAILNGATENNLSKQSPAAWPVWLLTKRGWKKIENKNRAALPPDFDAYYRAPKRQADAPREVEILIRRGDQSIALARTLALGENWSWPFDDDGNWIEDGTVKRNLREALGGSKLKDFVESNRAFPLDVVGIGLESSFGGDPKDELRALSDRRGSRLARVAKDLLGDTTDASVSFRTLGLGRCLTVAAQRGSSEERKQRSLLLVAIARLSNDVVAASIESAILSIVLDSSDLIAGIDLKDYEYSYAAAKRLSGPLVWGREGPSRSPPSLTVPEALALRPSAKTLGEKTFADSP